MTVLNGGSCGVGDRENDGGWEANRYVKIIGAIKGSLLHYALLKMCFSQWL